MARVSKPEVNRPPLPWGSFWIACAAVFLAAFVVLEILLRLAGDTPGLSNDAAYWALWRNKARHAEVSTLVLTGTSRLQQGFSPEGWHEFFPQHRVLQLSNENSSPVAVLEDLARDPAFRGQVLCEVAPSVCYHASIRRQQELVDEYRYRFNPVSVFLASAKARLQERFCAANPSRSARPYLKAVLLGHSFYPNFVTMKPDRNIRLDFKKKARKRPWLSKFERPLNHYVENIGEARRDEAVQRLARAAEQIRRKGGKVVFLEYINSKDDAAKSFFWDVLMEKAESPGIYYKDDPELSRFITPDGTHLDGRDVPAYTRRLAQIIRERGWLD